MATTFKEEYQKALGERGLALASKRFAVQMDIDANARREDLEQILFGDGTNYGIVSVLSLYYAQIWQGQGRKTSKPLLHDSVSAKAQYQSDFALSVTPAGDGAGGLHPPQVDNPAAGQDDVDVNSIWLTTHGLDADPSGTGINQLIPPILNTIGVTASVNGDGRGPYTTQALALAQAAQDKGSGLLGLRTENSEVYSTGSSVLQWWIGQNGIDTPDNYTAKASLISGLSNLRNGLNSMVNLFQSTLLMLRGSGRAILDEFKVELPLGDEYALVAAISQFQNFISTIQGHVDFFTQYSDPSPATERSAINARLEDVKTYTQAIINGVNSRCDSIPSLMGNTHAGINKHLTHWVAEVVRKPDGPYAMILGARDMLAMAETNIKKKDDNLNFFEQDRNLWMELTLIQAIYDRAVLNLNKTIKRFETDIMWNLIQAANKYKVLSKPLSELSTPLSNEAWDESSGAWVTDKAASGFLNNMRTITPPAVTTVFRLVSFDTAEGATGDFQRADSFNTKSKQTDIISGDLPFTQQPDSLGPDGVLRSVISFDEETAKLVKERDFLWLNESETAQIIGVSDSNYMLDTDYGTINSLRKLTGLYYVAPVAPENSVVPNGSGAE
jgi:hypothetical protein